MAKQERPCLIVGNWKMYKTIDQALEFIDQVAPIAEKANCRVMLAVPFTAIQPLAKKVEGTNIVIGAQNMNDAQEGAFTGEVAGIMLKDVGATFVLIGHSERRHIFHEDNTFINRKVLRALECGLDPLLCIGETYEEHQEKKTQEVIKEQLTQGLAGASKDVTKTLMIAYEPVWAIGTGLAATKTIVDTAMKDIRAILGEMFTEKSIGNIPLLYGGSVNANNAKEYLESSEVDGLLVGSASLATDSFAKIISFRQNSSKVTSAT